MLRSIPLVLAVGATAAVIWETFHLSEAVDAVRSVAAGNPRFILAYCRTVEEEGRKGV